MSIKRAYEDAKMDLYGQEPHHQRTAGHVQVDSGERDVPSVGMGAGRQQAVLWGQLQRATRHPRLHAVSGHHTERPVPPPIPPRGGQEGGQPEDKVWPHCGRLAYGYHRGRPRHWGAPALQDCG